MRRLTPAIALLLTVALAADAAAYTIRGRGNGHGVGMSQWGAYGYAKHGVGYRDILRHYFKHTAVHATGNHTVRVLLEAGAGSISFAGATDAGGHALSHGRTYVAELA